MTQRDNLRVESLGPAERILQALLNSTDHLVHHRPGVVERDGVSPVGHRWSPATVRNGSVYKLSKKGRGSEEIFVGTLAEDGVTITRNRQPVARYQRPGLYTEAAVWLYEQIATVWHLDNDFAARWASWAFAQDHRDLKVALAAFMLVQSRSGEPVIEDGELLFHDDDHRAVGEAMCLIRRRDGKDLNPKLLLRVGDLLRLDGVAQLNRRLGFGRSTRSAPLGRWPKVVTRWLRHREQNPKMLQGLVRAGYRRTVTQLCRRVGYKPLTPRFFELLRWKQSQSGDGRRSLALGVELAAAETWDGLSEREICERVVSERPAWKRIVGMIPAEIGLTRAIVAAAIESGCASDADLIVMTPTLEDLDLLKVTSIGERWLEASEKAENQRAASVARRVRKKETAEKLQAAADAALQRTVAEATRGLRVYVAVDISGSMGPAIDQAKGYLASFLQGFPLDQLHVCVFNTSAREVVIRHPSAKGVEHAFKGFRAGGGTSHASAFDVLRQRRPAPDEDALILWVGDQQEHGQFAQRVQASGLNPVAFGFLEVKTRWPNTLKCIEATATALNIPCFRLDEAMFGDSYAVSRTLRRLIESTPVGSRPVERKLLVETILETPLLTRPLWAA
ncbi:MAG: VWA domain-containing protein [Alphaproteobacteria bacterium]|nr:VWA domain-containing protein [Alphaproteobacteria bacterium]